jgi:hypothetical protein
MIIKDARVSDAATHVTGGHGTGIDHAGQYKEKYNAWLAVFIDQSIMPPCTAAARRHVDSSLAARLCSLHATPWSVCLRIFLAVRGMNVSCTDTRPIIRHRRCANERWSLDFVSLQPCPPCTSGATGTTWLNDRGRARRAPRVRNVGTFPTKPFTATCQPSPLAITPKRKPTQFPPYKRTHAHSLHTTPPHHLPPRRLPIDELAPTFALHSAVRARRT